MTSFKPTLPAGTVYKTERYEQLQDTGQFIHQIGEYTALREKSQQVELSSIPTTEFQAKLEYLKSCLITFRSITGIGRGITAVQVGIPERFSVVYIPPDTDEAVKALFKLDSDSLVTIINPVITKTSDKKFIFPEMCMSAEPIIAPVVRPATVELEYYDETGAKQLFELSDETQIGKILNRVIQHEVDHMEGIICVDKADPAQLRLDVDPDFYSKAIFEEVE
ncbi:MAG: peptide deformylase [Weeksellaceae bacterium]